MIFARPESAFTAVLGGADTGLAGTLGVRIEKGDGTNQTPRTTAGIVELEAGAGVYAKDDLIAPAAAGTYVVLWDDGSGDFASEELVVNAAGAPVTGTAGYPSTAVLVAASTVGELTGLEAVQQDALRESAISAVERHCRQSFAPALEATMNIDGNGMTTLYLPRRLATFTGIEIDGTAGDLEGYSLNDRHNRLSIRPPGSFGTWQARMVAQWEAEDFGQMRDFPIGSDNIAVAGVWGWTDAEYAAELGDVTEAIRLDMEDQAVVNASKLASAVRQARSLGLDQISQGGLSASLGRREPTVSPRVRRVLAGSTPSGEKLRWPRATGAVV